MGTSVVENEKENVLIEASGPAGFCSLTLLPQFGGKIASLEVNGHQLLQPPLAPIEPRSRTMAFDEADASGWDECLPSVAACSVSTEAGPARIPDHGDLWRVPWTQTWEGDADRKAGSITVRHRAACFSLPLVLTRTLDLAETERGWRLGLGYLLTNTGDLPVPWSWSAHPLFLTTPGDRLILPSSIRSLRLEGSRAGRLGKNGDSVSWPVATLDDGTSDDLSMVRPPDSEIGDKLFAGPLTANENWCVLERQSAGVRIRMSFDVAATPYLGLWICHGGWPERPGPKQTCVAMEPSTAPVDSLAQTGPWSRTLEPGGSAEWAIAADFELI